LPEIQADEKDRMNRENRDSRVIMGSADVTVKADVISLSGSKDGQLFNMMRSSSDDERLAIYFGIMRILAHG
jgi:hypothetical protein